MVSRSEQKARAPWHQAVYKSTLTCSAVTPSTTSIAHFTDAGAALRLTTGQSSSAAAAVVCASVRWLNCTAAVFSKRLRHQGLNRGSVYSSGTNWPFMSG